jgi:hypothetical protein
MRVAAVVGADEQLGQGEGLLDHRDDLIGDLGLVDADEDGLRLLGPGRAQHIEPRAVAVIDLEAEFAGGLDHLDVHVDDGDVDVAGQQRLGHDLGEAAETDDQDPLAQVLGMIDALGVVGVQGRRA